MRTEVEFVSDAFPPYPSEEEDINPGIWGKRLAEYIAAKLPEHGIKTKPFYAEDWGWAVPIENEAFSIFIGCGHMTEPEDNRFLCFIDPSTPEIRKWFKKINTVADVTRVADALDKVLTNHPEIRDLQWSEDEA